MHLFSRIVTLIIWPICIICVVFYIHFSILVNSGPADTLMSARFQQTLHNNYIYTNNTIHMYTHMPRYVRFGSIVSIRNAHFNPLCWLHSDNNTYPHIYK